jgi:glycosyltransferase involved in cell wall biosynthesis
MRLAVQLPRLGKENGIDLIHTQYICPLIGETPNAVTIHDILFEAYPQYFEPVMRLRSKLLFRRSARRAQMVFTVSEYSKQQIAETYNVSLSRLTTVRNGVDLRRFCPGSEGSTEVEALGLVKGQYLLTVGRLEPRKNHLGILRAVAALPYPRPRLVIVGQKDFGYEQIFRMRDELQLQNEVQFLEAADNSLLAALYRNARAFLYPTFAEGFGMPVLEAMASGIPVITSNTTSLPEISGGAALLVDPSSTESIASALRRIFSDAALASRMGAQGRKHAEKCTWESSVEILANAYKSYFFHPTR